MSQITIQQAAGQLNLANSDLLWEVTSAQSGSAQFQYTCILRDGCNNTLTTIDISNNDVGYEGARVIAEAVKINTTLTTLILRCCNIGESWSKLIAEALKTNTTIQIITS